MTRLDQEERYQIYAMKRADFSQKTITDELGRNTSTFCCEVKRNTRKNAIDNKPKSKKVYGQRDLRGHIKKGFHR